MSSPPFGIQKGISKNDIKVGEELGIFFYEILDVPKPLPEFPKIYALITPLHGVCKISAVTKKISTDVQGLRLKNRFETLTNILANKYGKPSIYDDELQFVDGVSFTWMDQLLKQEIFLNASWGKRKNLPNDLTGIFLNVFAEDSCNGNLELSYFYDNYDLANEEIKKLMEDVL